MFVKALAITAILALGAAPAFAAAHKAAPKADTAAPDHTGPIPYSELADADAKLNAPAPKKVMKHHKKHVAAKATSSTATTAPAPAAK